MPKKSTEKSKQKAMAKEHAEKYKRASQRNAERQRKFKANMSEEQIEKKKQRDRDRYYKLKEEKKTKSIAEMTNKEKIATRKDWKKKKAAYRQKKKETAVQENVPLEVPNLEDIARPQSISSQPSRQKQIGRKTVRKDRSQAYRDLAKSKEENKKLKTKLEKYKKRLEREKKKKRSGNNLASPSPSKKVKQIVGSEKVSPLVKKRLFLGFTLEKQIKENLLREKTKSKNKQIMKQVIGSKILKKYRVQKELKHIVPYSYNKNKEKCKDGSLMYKKKKYQTVKIKEAVKIRHFFENDTVSKCLPGKKDYVKRGPLKKQRRVLIEPIKTLYQRFKNETGIEISLSVFARSRPFWVTKPKPRDRETCGCIKHENIEMLISSLKRTNLINYKNASELLKMSVCSTDSEKCMTNKCQVCLNKDIQYKQVEEETSITYWKWKTVTELRIIKNVQKNIKRVIKSKETSTLADVKVALRSELQIFKKHVFSMKHQAKCMKILTDNLHENQLMFHVDFSQNYVAKCASEIQAMHFGASKKQISLHTGLMYNRQENGEVKPSSFCTVSDNLDHQAHGVWAHLMPILEEAANTFPNTETVIFFSDSPSSQYRNKTNLFFMHKFLPQLFFNLKSFTWNFTEPGHGKGAMDGVGGSVKRSADSHVLHGKDIVSAEDFVNLFDKSSIKVILVPFEDVKKMKEKIPKMSKTIKGIMSVKQITWEKGGVLNARRLTCLQCDPGKKCSHYHLMDIDGTTPTTMKKPLKVSEVYSSDSDNDIPPVTSPIILKPVTFDDITLGNFVVVSFSFGKKQQSSKNFVAVLQSEVDESREVNVMFMKPSSTYMTSFCPDETDISYISCDQILGILPQPTMMQKGNRIFYKFDQPITL